MITTWSGWIRVFAIIMGLIAVSAGSTVIFTSVMVTGLLNVLALSALIMMGLWSITLGVSGRRNTLQSTVAYFALTEALARVSEEGISTAQ